MRSKFRWNAVAKMVLHQFGLIILQNLFFWSRVVWKRSNLPGREWTSATRRIGNETRGAYRQLDGDEWRRHEALATNVERKTERTAKFVALKEFWMTKL
jgi:hypothetical protein